ncbi:glycosyltransferase [Bosea sp. (in: a-proteobacteria)]|uniref:glycosyltransferase n=1 Tax=Bosea sp. (in: a-proteobacteria) TaxID=1871050 RepID=UPI002736A820|nr:glycosyltransferase [Bosea sp. (in: a-proteobacteria)]MDP3410494.1 glycosyltransferase [Bosea sp. (in: a-proteobacteria)]
MMHDTVTLDVRPPEPRAEGALVSVVIPLAEHEAIPEALLAMLPKTFEIVLARGGSRASSMNHAASVAQGRHLWFVHADTTLGADAVPRLLERLQEPRAAVRYFDLRFDGGALMRLTEGGVSFRSRVIGLPFGDQALCLPAEMFHALGGYDETAAHGEDHQLVRDARRAGLAIQPVGATITTSARKYRDKGWFRTTFLHLRLTLLQSLRAS